MNKRLARHVVLLTCLTIAGVVILTPSAATASLLLTLADHSGEDHSGEDHSGQDLFGINLSNAQLVGTNLSGSILFFADLSGANLSGANLTGSLLDFADLTGADLSGSTLDASTALLFVNLSGANLSGADLSLADLASAGSKAMYPRSRRRANPRTTSTLRNGEIQTSERMSHFPSTNSSKNISSADRSPRTTTSVDL